MSRGQRVIYTTPLKALSNQKLYEMRLRFGSDRVGLQTGDATLNVDRDIVVMTTEILRNIMYRTEPGTEGISSSSLPLVQAARVKWASSMTCRHSHTCFDVSLLALPAGSKWCPLLDCSSCSMQGPHAVARGIHSVNQNVQQMGFLLCRHITGTNSSGRCGLGGAG